MNRKRVLITAGPTREYLDPVRFITNQSSGSMGISIAREFLKQGFQVDVVLGPTEINVPVGIKCHKVISALEMAKVVEAHLPYVDVFVATAAVADYRFKTIHARKIKKQKNQLTLKLIKNPDILKNAGSWKKKWQLSKPILIGFALETENLKQNARKKMNEKYCDLVIGNSPASFSSNIIHPLWVEKDKPVLPLNKMTKVKLARKLCQWIKKK